MTKEEFRTKIKELDQNFEIFDNPNRPGLANIFYNGKNFDLPVISSTEIKEEIDPTYKYEFPNGYSARFWSAPEVLGRLEKFLEQFKSGALDEDYKTE